MRSNLHHLWWPRKNYLNGIERIFRELPCNKVEIDVMAHAMLHRFSPPPKKPSHEFMQQMVEHHEAGKCCCIGTRIPIVLETISRSVP